MTEQVVLVLSGGGAKAAAHIGAARALEEAGVGVARYVGTSMGAVIAAALAAGRTPAALAADVGTLKERDVASFNPHVLWRGIRARALLRAEPLRKTIERIVGAASFGTLRHPVTATAVDLDTGDLVLFGAGGEDAPLIDALYASCALPVFYPATTIGGRRLGDGGLRAVVPLLAAQAQATETIVAVDVGPGFDEAVPQAAPRLPALVRAHNDAVRILMAASTASLLATWPRTGGPRLVYVRPPIDRGATFAVGRAAHYEGVGYAAMRRAWSAP